ncbi:MAG TPA: hypothetical protein VF453_17685 [Burkholderiaceae bacterium]
MPAWPQLAAWARENGWSLKRTIAHDGWVMDHEPGHPGWRVEWGPAQRGFMSSHELRIRLETPRLPENMQALVLDRPLLARLDREVYQQITDSVQTRLDEETPEEMRWLAMHAKLSPNQMGVPLRDRYGGLCSEPEWLSRWLAGPVSAALKKRADVMPVEAVSAEPFALRLARGQMVLRQAAPALAMPAFVASMAVAEAVDATLGAVR